MKRLFRTALAALALILVVVLVRAIQFKPALKAFTPLAKVPLEVEALAQRLSANLKFPTRSYFEKEKNDPQPFRDFHASLRRQFPLVFSRLKVQTVGGFGLLIEWPGREAALKPILLLAHQDVVPVAPGTEKDWTQPAFSGAIEGGFIWGRGAIDDKSSLVGILEAAEKKLGEGFQPARSLFFAFGSDEETGGESAAEMAVMLKARGLTFETILDEGGFISEGIVPEVTPPVALVGIAEKGYVSVTLVANERPGHSSTPPKKTAIGRVSRAITRLEARPFPARLDGPMRSFLEKVGPEMRFSRRLALANLWLFGPLIVRGLSGSPASNASIRTTIAPTIFQSGEKENVLPAVARAVVNFRTMPGDSTETVLAHVREAIDDSAIELMASTHGEPSTVSDISSLGFTRLEQVIREIYPTAVVAPNLTVASTDSKHYGELSHSVLRFLPVRFGPMDLARFHGTNERINVQDYADCVRFYLRYLELLSMP